MSTSDSLIDIQLEHTAAATTTPEESKVKCSDVLRSLLDERYAAPCAAPVGAVVVGRLLALADNGCRPLVAYPHHSGTAALRAGTIVDLYDEHIGRPVVLAFEDGDATRPIVIGLMRGEAHTPQQSAPGQIEVDADGERVLVSASKQLVLRCGAASITLTDAGKVLIRGTYVLSQSSGANRVKGGSIQLN